MADQYGCTSNAGLRGPWGFFYRHLTSRNPSLIKTIFHKHRAPWNTTRTIPNEETSFHFPLAHLNGSPASTRQTRSKLDRNTPVHLNHRFPANPRSAGLTQPTEEWFRGSAFGTPPRRHRRRGTAAGCQSTTAALRDLPLRPNHDPIRCQPKGAFPHPFRRR